MFNIVQNTDMLNIVIEPYIQYNINAVDCQHLFINEQMNRNERGNFMEWLSDFINKHKKLIIILFVAASAVGVVLFFCTPVNYNMMDYLPDKANSTQALSIMQDEFDQPLPNLNVMVEDVSLAEALDYKDKVKNADYVKEVLWLDDTIDLNIPLEVQDKDTVETYYKDGNALYMVSVEDGNERDAIASIKELIGDNCKVSGSAADQATSQKLAVNEALKAIILILPVTILILILVTESWIEPLFYLLNIGTPVLISLGTNIFMGEISFVTLAAAPVLQIAVSLDYAVFLSHSFTDYKRKGLKPVDAMGKAISTSISSIGASMLTTLFGFVALLFMQFRIGADMGISLVKGILISFLCVMVFFPALLLQGNNLIEKTRHKPFIPSFKNIGKGIEKIRIPVAVILVIIMIPSFLAQANNQYFYGSSEKTAEGSAAWDIEQEFGTANSSVLMVPKGESNKETILCNELKDIDHVTAVTSYATMVSNKIPEAYLDESVVNQFYSENYARIIISADCAYEGKDSFTMVENIKNTAQKYYPDDYYLCGQSANMYDIKDFSQQDNNVVTLITVICIYLVLLIMTKNWFTPLLLILTIECSIWLNMSIPYFMGDKLSYLGYLIVSTVQMGATIDYAILLTNTYNRNRIDMDKKTAVRKTLGDVFPSLLISAATLCLSGFCLNWTSSNEVVKVLGGLIGRGALLAICMVMLLLPVFLLISDKLIPYTYLFGKGKKKKELLKNEKQI